MSLTYLLQRLVHGVLLLIGVTLLSFLLMVEFGPDPVYRMLGKNPTTAQIEELRRELGQDRPFLARYATFLGDLARLDLGHSDSSGEPVADLLARTLPITLALVLPGFLIGNLLGIALGMQAARRKGRWPDHVVMAGSVTGMSLSFLVIIIVLQVLLCTPYGLNLLPARGWEVDSLSGYFTYATVPTLALVLVTLGFNTRFYRAVFVEELGSDYVRTLRAYGGSHATLLLRHVLKNSMVPIGTRFLFSIPLILVSGSLLLESYFGIPGVGRVTFDAITSGDQPVLQAMVTLTAVAFVGLQLLAELLYRVVDPRVAAP